MNNYKERYELIEKNISEIENTKEKQEQSLKIEGMKLEASKLKISELELEIDTLKYKRNKMVKSKEKLINTITEIITTVFDVLLVYAGIITYGNIAPIGIIKPILTVLGLISLYGTACIFGNLGINTIGNFIKKKIYRKNANKKECLKFTEQINTKKKELEEEKIIQNQIKEKIERIVNQINNQKELLTLKKEELEKLYKEILIATLDTQILTKPPVVSEETTVEEKTNQKTRVKKGGIGHRR